MEGLLFMLGFFAIFMLFTVLFALALAHAMKSLKKGNELWARVAENFGLTYLPGGFASGSRISGTFASVPLEVATLTRRSKLNHDRRVLYIVIRAWIPSHHAPRMLIRREGLLQKAAKVLHGEVQVGDEALDKALLIKAPDEQAVRALLTHPTVKEVLLKAVRRYPGMKIEQNHLRVEFRAAGIDERAFCDHINACAYVTKAMAHSAEQLFGEPAPPAQRTAPGQEGEDSVQVQGDAEGWW